MLSRSPNDDAKLEKAVACARKILGAPEIQQVMHGKENLDAGLILDCANILSGDRPPGLFGSPHSVHWVMLASHYLRIFAHQVSGVSGNVDRIHELRDNYIRMAVWEVSKFGFRPTRSQERRPSACSIIADELGKLGIGNLSEGSVQDIYMRGGTTEKQRSRWKHRHMLALIRELLRKP